MANSLASQSCRYLPAFSEMLNHSARYHLGSLGVIYSGDPIFDIIHELDSVKVLILGRLSGKDVRDKRNEVLGLGLGFRLGV